MGAYRRAAGGPVGAQEAEPHLGGQQSGRVPGGGPREVPGRVARSRVVDVDEQPGAVRGRVPDELAQVQIAVAENVRTARGSGGLVPHPGRQPVPGREHGGRGRIVRPGRPHPRHGERGLRRAAHGGWRGGRRRCAPRATRSPVPGLNRDGPDAVEAGQQHSRLLPRCVVRVARIHGFPVRPQGDRAAVQLGEVGRGRAGPVRFHAEPVRFHAGAYGEGSEQNAGQTGVGGQAETYGQGGRVRVCGMGLGDDGAAADHGAVRTVREDGRWRTAAPAPGTGVGRLVGEGAQRTDDCGGHGLPRWHRIGGHGRRRARRRAYADRVGRPAHRVSGARSPGTGRRTAPRPPSGAARPRTARCPVSSPADRTNAAVRRTPVPTGLLAGCPGPDRSSGPGAPLSAPASRPRTTPV